MEQRKTFKAAVRVAAAAALSIVMALGSLCVTGTAVGAGDPAQESSTAATVAAAVPAGAKQKETGEEAASQESSTAATAAVLAGAKQQDEAGEEDAPQESSAAATSAAAVPAAEFALVESGIPFWTENSAALTSILDFVDAATDETSDRYLPPAERIAVFDSDGTLFGELFPTYFDQCLLMHRLLHDETFEGNPEDVAFAAALEKALLNHEPEPDSDRSTAQMAAESFKGFTIEEYRAYIRRFMSESAVGFDGMTYGDAFYRPMAALVQFLAEHDFKIFICSGAETTLLRELCRDALGEWIPPYQVIGTTFSLTASNQGDKAGRSYTYGPDDEVLLEGNMTFKNLKMNKVVSIVDRIGAAPVLAFGNSSGDYAMAQYTLQHGGKAYMLLCDDSARDYGDPEKAAKTAQECEKLGFETISMKNDFTTIYGENVKKTEYRKNEDQSKEDLDKENTGIEDLDHEEKEELRPAA